MKVVKMICVLVEGYRSTWYETISSYRHSNSCSSKWGFSYTANVM